MKKFSRIKSVDEIRAQCGQRKDLKFSDEGFRRGGDYITVSGGGCKVFYNTFNGRFVGYALIGPHMAFTEFNSSSVQYEREAWFQGLSRFFYVE